MQQVLLLSLRPQRRLLASAKRSFCVVQLNRIRETSDGPFVGRLFFCIHRWVYFLAGVYFHLYIIRCLHNSLCEYSVGEVALVEGLFQRI
jgi:hypothetical protein